jgi:hypothetical protein
LVSGQHHVDEYPRVMMIPFNVGAPELWNWKGSGMEFLVICKDPETYVAIRANTLYSEQSYVSCKDPAVVRSLHVFGEVLASTIRIVRNEDIDEQDLYRTNGSKARRFEELNTCRNFRGFLRAATEFQAPKVKPTSDGFILKVKLDDARIVPPGERSTGADWAAECTSHPCPDPVNLMCRSYNAFSTHLFRRNELAGMPGRDSETCKLMPSCVDLEGLIDCNLCLASSLLCNPFICLSSENKEHLRSIVNLEITGDSLLCRSLLMESECMDSE